MATVTSGAVKAVNAAPYGRAKTHRGWSSDWRLALVIHSVSNDSIISSRGCATKVSLWSEKMREKCNRGRVWILTRSGTWSKQDCTVCQVRRSQCQRFLPCLVWESAHTTRLTLISKCPCPPCHGVSQMLLHSFFEYVTLQALFAVPNMGLEICHHNEIISKPGWDYLLSQCRRWSDGFYNFNMFSVNDAMKIL